MSDLHLVLPHDIDDPVRPSGGNRYDRRLADGLVALGWRVVEHVVPDPRTLAAELASLPDDALVMLDGLLASVAPGVLTSQSDRLRQIVLVHAPLGLGDGRARRHERRALHAADAVVATSAWTAEWLRANYGLTAAVALPGVDVAPVTPLSPLGTRLLSVGAVTPLKGHDVLLDALAAVPDVACEVVGSLGVDPDYAARLARRESGVRWLGPLTGERLDEAYRRADLLVLPSRHETYGMVVTEALARGVPVLASDVGGVGEALGLTPFGVPGLLVPPGDPDALAAALRRWLDDAAVRGRLRAAAHVRRATLDRWSVTAGRVGQVLSAVAAPAAAIA